MVTSSGMGRASPTWAMMWSWTVRRVSASPTGSGVWSAMGAAIGARAWATSGSRVRDMTVLLERMAIGIAGRRTAAIGQLEPQPTPRAAGGLTDLAQAVTGEVGRG